MKMKLNREWHLANRMPKNATLDQRVEWHLEHEKQCGCREDVPRTVRAELERRAAQAGNR